MNRTAALYALVSAALFGISTPAAKSPRRHDRSHRARRLLYCGAGIGVAMLRRLAHAFLAPADAGAEPFGDKDIPWLAGAIAAGGIAGPILLMTGLARTDAAAASLLLTLEGAATALMAWFIFHENFDRRVAFGMVFLVAGAAALAWSGTPTLASIVGPLAIIGCVHHVGPRQQFDAQSIAGRSPADCRTQGTDCRAGQRRTWTVGWRVAAGRV